MKLYSVRFCIASLLLVLLSGCGGGGNDGGSTPSSGTSPTVSGVAVSGVAVSGVAISGVAQGPLVNNSTVTAQEVDSTLAPTSAKPSSYTVKSDLGSFSAPSTFSSPYIDLTATGKYYDEVVNAVSAGTVTLSSYASSSDAYLNVNILTTLAYQRIKTLVRSGMTFSAARRQAENEVLIALNFRDGNSQNGIFGSSLNFGSLDLSKGRDDDHILAAISSMFVPGNTYTYGQVIALIASFQADIAATGNITITANKNALINNAMGINPTIVASNLTSKYSSAGLSFLPTDISNWLDQDGDNLIGKFKFQVVQAPAGTPYIFPIFTVGPSDAGATYSLSASSAACTVKGVAAIPKVALGDPIIVTCTPSLHDASRTYLKNGTANVARYDFNPFAVVGGLTTARTALTATTLQNGQILVAGGLVAGTTPTSTSSAELYNPVTNQWTSAPSMKNARAGHTATLLKNGQVLVVGGDDAKDTAELYDPVTNKWTATQSPAFGRTYHTATLLQNGQVLVTGGTSIIKPATLPSAVNTAELYDPNSYSWNYKWSTPLVLPNMSTPRYNHTATLLQNGTVLIVGGLNGNIAAGTSELFRLGNSWEPPVVMNTPRHSHSATLLNDGMSVLIAGGFGTANTALPSAELYMNGIWSFAHNLNTGRFRHIAQLLSDGKVLVAGGAVNSNGTYLSSAELYDSNTDSWTSNGNLTYARDAFGAVMLNSGKVLMVGGLGVKAAETFE